jgi:hypothetical protein
MQNYMNNTSAIQNNMNNISAMHTNTDQHKCQAENPRPRALLKGLSHQIRFA